MKNKITAGILYSTDPKIRETAGTASPPDSPGSPSVGRKRPFHVEVTRSGRNGNDVTLIKHLNIQPGELKELLNQLKTKAAAGGTIKDTIIELQGNHLTLCRKIVADWLKKREGD